MKKQPPLMDCFPTNILYNKAIDMARDAICMKICYEQDQGKSDFPDGNIDAVTIAPSQTMALVDVDVDAYRRAHENRVVRKNLTIPSWLNEEAEAAGVNFSQTLQDALKEKLNIQDFL